MGSPRGIGLALAGFAGVAAAEGRAERAVRLAGAAARLHETTGTANVIVEPAALADTYPWLAAAQQALGEPQAAAAWARGSSLALEDAIAYGLQEEPAAPAAPGGATPPPPPETPEAAPAAGSAGARRLPAGLTQREADVLRLVAEGKTNREIAATLVLSEKTVGRHLSNIFDKLGVSTRAAATAFSLREGIA